MSQLSPTRRGQTITSFARGCADRGRTASAGWATGRRRRARRGGGRRRGGLRPAAGEQDAGHHAQRDDDPAAERQGAEPAGSAGRGGGRAGARAGGAVPVGAGPTVAGGRQSGDGPGEALRRAAGCPAAARAARRGGGLPAEARCRGADPTGRAGAGRTDGRGRRRRRGNGGPGREARRPSVAGAAAASTRGGHPLAAAGASRPQPDAVGPRDRPSDASALLRRGTGADCPPASRPARRGSPRPARRRASGGCPAPVGRPNAAEQHLADQRDPGAAADQQDAAQRRDGSTRADVAAPGASPATVSASAGRIIVSNSARVSRTVVLSPGSATGTRVSTSVDSASLASTQSRRSRASADGDRRVVGVERRGVVARARQDVPEHRLVEVDPAEVLDPLRRSRAAGTRRRSSPARGVERAAAQVVHRDPVARRHPGLRDAYWASARPPARCSCWCRRQAGHRRSTWSSRSRLNGPQFAGWVTQTSSGRLAHPLGRDVRPPSAAAARSAPGPRTARRRP